MSEGRRRVVEKAYAYVTRRDGAELLVFEPPSGEGPEVPKGGIEPGEDPAEAVVRELREETGLADAEVVAAVATDEWPHPSKPKTYRRHFFHVAVADAPDEWVHEVTGGGEDDGLRYTCHWMGSEDAGDALIREQGAYLDALDAREDA
ncbi:NUDIX hydrolase [Halarchaeum sp. P4]|uniref:NUDIX hydrolase n=1 Tax=Halarchaeum sp. P4 TaxID=3421639 RepID=UPI003EBE2E03